MNYLRKNLVYGLAGFFAASALIVTGTKAFGAQEILGYYFWLMPIGFILGLVFPQYMGGVFVNLVSRDPIKDAHGRPLNPEDEVKGPIAIIVRLIAIAALAFLLFVAFVVIKDSLSS